MIGIESGIANPDSNPAEIPQAAPRKSLLIGGVMEDNPVLSTNQHRKTPSTVSADSPVGGVMKPPLPVKPGKQTGSTSSSLSIDSVASPTTTTTAVNNNITKL